MFRRKRLVFLLVIFALCFLTFKLLPSVFFGGIPAAENPGDCPGGEDPEKENITGQIPEIPAGQPEPADPAKEPEQGPASSEENNEPVLPTDRSCIEQLDFLQSPLPGAQVTSRDSQLPGAPRTYRNGTHEGLDYYGGACGIPIEYGTPVYAAGEGIICRIDHHYAELAEQERDGILQVSSQQKDTPADILDQLRGRQVWIQHTGDVKTVYAHLSNVAENLEEGDHVGAGDFIGEVGNSGTSDGMKGTTANSHLHFEIWVGDNYLGQGLSADEARRLLKELLE